MTQKNSSEYAMHLKDKNVPKYQYEKIRYTKSYILSKDKELHIYDNVSKFLKNKRKKFKMVLDCGCGYGRSINLLKNKSEIILGVDISKRAIKKASKYIGNKKQKKIIFINADIEKLPFKDESFDLIISIESLPYTNSPQRYVKEIKRVLDRKGILIISIENKYGGILSDQYISKNDLIRAIKTGKTQNTKYFTNKEFSDFLKKMGFSIIFEDKIGFAISGIFQRFDFNKREIKTIEQLCKKDKVLSNLSRGLCFICKKN